MIISIKQLFRIKKNYSIKLNKIRIKNNNIRRLKFRLKYIKKYFIKFGCLKLMVTDINKFRYF